MWALAWIADSCLCFRRERRTAGYVATEVGAEALNAAPRRLLEERVAIVTGGAAGLGAGIASTLASAGARGVILDVVEPLPDEVPQGWFALRVDVSAPPSVEQAFAEATRRAGIPNVVVANAGVVPPWTTAAEIDPGEWDDVFSVNARGVMLTIREAIRHMRVRGGSIVVTSSLNGWKGDAHIPAYVASKHAVVGLVRSVAIEVGRQGIRVNAVGPGPVPTKALLSRMAARAVRGEPAVDEALRIAAASTTLGRLVTVQEVANAVLFLASDLSSGITGHLLPVDGGVQ